jgi:RNA polymerase sigma-70 factor, ECF subfamily
MEDSMKEELLEKAMKDFGQEVLYIAFSYVKDFRMAEDITQEVFIKLYTKMESFRGESSLKTWVISIAINQSKDYLKRWETQKLFFTDKIADFFRNNDRSLEKRIIKKEIDNDLLKNVLTLPLKYREVIILYYFEELKMIEIADCLSININTVKTRLNRAKELLGEMYPEGVHISG